MHRAQLLSIAVVIILFPAISHAADPNTITNRNPPAAQPILDYRTRILPALSQETTLESIENLANYDDVLPVTSMLSGGELVPEVSYKHARLVSTQLSRMRKIYAAAQDNPEQVIAVLMQKLSSSADNFEQCAADWEYRIDNSEGMLVLSEPDNYEKRRASALASAYLLAELHAYESLPLMHKVFTTEGRSPVNRVFLFYSMHLLAMEHPTDNLSPEAHQALDAYISATQDVPQPELVDVPTWNAAYDDSDFRQVILGRDMTENQPKIQMRAYPKAMEQYEVVKMGIGPKDRYQVSPQITKSIGLLKDFIDKAY